MSIRIDLYTKAVLTVIAVCLITLCLRTLQQPPTVAAQGNALRVVIAGFDATDLQGGLPVKLLSAGENTVVPVSVVGGGRNGQNALPVQIQNDPQSSVLVHVDNEILPANVTQVAGRNITRDGVPTVPGGAPRPPK